MTSILYTEIHSQPERLRACLHANLTALGEVATLIRSAGITSCTMVARGTSRHAALYGAYLLGAHQHMPVHLFRTGMAAYLRAQPLHPGTCLIGISQSGSGPDLNAVLQQAVHRSVPVFALTNNEDSDMAGLATRHVGIQAGPEHAIAATKSFTNQLMCLAILDHCLSKQKATYKDLDSVSGHVEEALSTEDPIRALAARLKDAASLMVVGRGFNHPVACEAALKFQEVCYLPTVAYTSADFIHGPQALLEPDRELLCLDAGSEPNPQFREIEELAHRAGARVTAVTSDPQRWREPTTIIELPGTRDLPDWLAPFPAVAACQLLAYRLGLARSLDVDSPRNLKKVTLTR